MYACKSSCGNLASNMSCFTGPLFTQCSHDAITVTWTTRYFNHFTSEHYKVSKSEVFEKVIPAVNLRISADDICQRWRKYSGLVLCKFWGNSRVIASTSRHWKPQESSTWRWFHIASKCNTGQGVALPGCCGGLGLGGRPCWLSVPLCW